MLRFLVFSTLVAGALCFGQTLASAGDVRMEVADDQTITLSGSFDSLSEMFALLCERAGVELRSYDAPDRRVIASYEGQVFTQVIERLLSRENYLLGMRPGSAQEGGMRVAWIRVTGAKNSGAGAPIVVPSRPKASAEKESLTEDSPAKGRAEEAVTTRLLADDARVAHFLRADPVEIAESLRQYPGIEQALRTVQGKQHPAVADKLDEVLDALANLGKSTD